MKQFKTVFQFELKTLLLNKSFLIATAIISIISLAFMSIPTFMNLFGNVELQSPFANNPDQVEDFVIVYESDELESSMSAILGQESYSTEAELMDAVRSEEISSGFIIQDFNRYKYISFDRSFDSFEQFVFEEQLRKINQGYLFAQEGIDNEKVYEILDSPIEAEDIILGKDASSGTGIAYAIIFILYMLILLYGNNVATSVAKEKDSRTMELLITSTKPKILILGKVAAVGLTGVIQTVIILLFVILGFFLNKVNYDEFILDMVEGSMSLDVIFVYILFSLLGYILYLFIFASLGSLVSKVEDVAKSTAPITYLFVIAYIAASLAMTMPDNSIIKVTSFIPFISMFTMPIRYMMTTVSLFHLIVSGILMVLTVYLFSELSIYIYRFGSLNYGNRLSLKEVVKAIKRK